MSEEPEESRAHHVGAVPAIDHNKIVDWLAWWAKQNDDQSHAFTFDEYDELERSQAVRGRAMAWNSFFTIGILKLVPSLRVKTKLLQNPLMACLAKCPIAKWHRVEIQQGHREGDSDFDADTLRTCSATQEQQAVFTSMCYLRRGCGPIYIYMYVNVCVSVSDCLV